MSLHRVDPRFVLPHPVRRAVVLGGLEGWASGLDAAGVELVPASAPDPPDLAVGPARLVGEAARTGARSIIVEGSSERALRRRGFETRRVLLRPTRERPTLALPLDQLIPVSYALERWSVVDRRWKTARLRAARALVSHGAFPAWASPLVTVATGSAGAPCFVAAAAELGVPPGVHWFLTFGQGDALSRNAFQLFPADANAPAWVLKFSRVAGYSRRFENDEQGLLLAQRAGGAVAARVPRLVGRFEVEGVDASLETAAAGRRLRDVLLTPGDRAGKLGLVDRIAGWILELGRLTRAPPEAQATERRRLRDEVLPGWTELGVSAELVDRLAGLPAVAQHNDLGSWNVVADRGDFVVVDWENTTAAGLPLWDLLYFLADALVLIDGPAAPEGLPARIARLFAGEAPSSQLLFSWVRRGADESGTPYDAVAALATLCWLSHSSSHGAHNADIAAWAPGDPPRLHGIEGVGRAWLEHAALGPGWNVWRA